MKTQFRNCLFNGVCFQFSVLKMHFFPCRHINYEMTLFLVQLHFALSIRQFICRTLVYRISLYFLLT